MKTRRLYNKVAIVYNGEKGRAREEWLRLTRWLKARHISVMGDVRVTSAMKHADFVIALGGDGTVLRVARSISGSNVPLLGVNVGRLGFLAATEVGTTYRTLKHILAGEGRVEYRSMLSITALTGSKRLGPFLALNECVVRSGATGRVIVLQAMIQKKVLASCIGDGLIVSTPTGSTAYNLAASGPIVHPEVDVMLICPICPHSLTQRPLVIPTTEVVTIQVDGPTPSAVLSIDGQLNHKLKLGDRVEIRMAAEQVPLLMDPDRSFYDVLHSKLKWG